VSVAAQGQHGAGRGGENQDFDELHLARKPFAAEMGEARPSFNRKRKMPGRRPPHLKPPAYLSKSPPVPAPDGDQGDTGQGSPEAGGPKGAEPTRYGDWEQKGICRDF